MPGEGSTRGHAGSDGENRFATETVRAFATPQDATLRTGKQPE
jgi:hypothetical protein